MNDITNRIKEMIKNKGLSQSDVAKKIGISPQSLSDKLNRHGNFTINFLISLDKALNGIDFNYLFHGKHDDSYNENNNTQKDVNRLSILVDALTDKIETLKKGKFKDIEIMPKAA